MMSSLLKDLASLSELESLSLVLVFMFGIVLGVIFFGGLWWTLRKGLGEDRSLASLSTLFLSSLLLRTGVTVFGFYWVGAGQWQRLLVCLLGFLLARYIVTRISGAPLKVESDNAS